MCPGLNSLILAHINQTICFSLLHLRKRVHCVIFYKEKRSLFRSVSNYGVSVCYSLRELIGFGGESSDSSDSSPQCRRLQK